MISFCKFCNKLTSGTFDAQHCKGCHVWFRPNRTTFYMFIKNESCEIDIDMENKTTTIKRVSGEEFDPLYDTKYMTWFGKHVMTVNDIPSTIDRKRVEEWATKLLKLKVFS